MNMKRFALKLFPLAFALMSAAAFAASPWTRWAANRPRNPRDLDGGSVALWLNANADNVTLVSSAVDVWKDRSTIAATANNASANSSARRPAWTAMTAGSGATVDFDGSTSILEMTQVTASGAATIAMRYKLGAAPGSGTAHYLFTLPMNATITFFGLAFCNIGGYQTISWGAKLGTQASVGISPTLDTSWHRLIITYNNGTATSTSSYTALLDGVSTTVNASSTLSLSNANLGGFGGNIVSHNSLANLYQGSVRDVVVYPDVLSASDIARLDFWLAAQP